MSFKSDKDKVTPKDLYLRRREFLKTSIYAGVAVGTAGLYRLIHPTSLLELSEESKPAQTSTPPTGDSTLKKAESLIPTSFHNITHYNNFYEFSTDKESVAEAAQNWKIDQWSLMIEGEVEKPLSLSLSDIHKMTKEDRTYRFRCVEGWSMVIPWQGFPLAKLLERVKPKTSARYVSFESFFDPEVMTGYRFAGIPLPYKEGLRLDEALHPLAFLATGLYGEDLKPQNGPALRLVVPWKYGFKSIKSVTRIVLTSEQPETTWNQVNPDEYGFYSNVNPNVDHPRWSQKRERVIGSSELIDTTMFNGYSEVASLYTGMDLEKNF